MRNFIISFAVIFVLFLISCHIFEPAVVSAVTWMWDPPSQGIVSGYVFELSVDGGAFTEYGRPGGNQFLVEMPFGTSIARVAGFGPSGGMGPWSDASDPYTRLPVSDVVWSWGPPSFGTDPILYLLEMSTDGGPWSIIGQFSGLSAAVAMPVGTSLMRVAGQDSLLRTGGYSPESMPFTRAPDMVPSFTLQPISQHILVGSPVTFSVQVQGTDPIVLQWQRDLVDIPGATAESYMIPAVVWADNGVMFRCIATNVVGNTVSSEAFLTIDLGPPGPPTAPVMEGG